VRWDVRGTAQEAVKEVLVDFVAHGSRGTLAMTTRPATPTMAVSTVPGPGTSGGGSEASPLTRSPHVPHVEVLSIVVSCAAGDMPGQSEVVVEPFD
jgi:hypothetical protein